MLRILLYLCLFWLRISKSSLIFNQTSRCEYKSIAFSTHFIQKYSTLIIISSSEEFLNQVYKYNEQALHASLAVYTKNFTLKPISGMHMEYAVVQDTLEEIDHELKKVLEYVETTTRILLLLNKNSCSDVTLGVQNLFEMAWSRKHLRNIIFIENSTNKSCDGIHVFVFNPFLMRTFKFDTSQGSQIKSFLNSKNYHGQVIKASLFESIPQVLKLNQTYMGMDWHVMKEIEKALNATITFQPPSDNHNYGFLYANGTRTGLIRELSENNVQIGFNQVFIKDYNVPKVGFTKIIVQDSLCILVPKATLIPRWEAIFYIYSPKIWLLKGFIILVTIGTFFMMRKYKTRLPFDSQHSLDYRITTIFFDVFQILYNSANFKIFSSQTHERIILAFIFLYGLTINTIFQSSLVTIISNPKRYPEINTLQDVIESDYLIWSSSQNLHDTFSGIQHGYWKQLNDRFKIVMNKDVSTSANYNANLTRKARQDYLDHLQRFEDISTHMVEECPRVFLLGYMVLKDAYFRKDFDEIIGRIFNSGLSYKWHEDALLHASSLRPSEEKSTETSPGSPRTLSVDDLQTVFYVLLIGNLWAFVIFCCEHILQKFNKYCFRGKNIENHGASAE